MKMMLMSRDQLGYSVSHHLVDLKVAQCTRSPYLRSLCWLLRRVRVLRCLERWMMVRSSFRGSEGGNAAETEGDSCLGAGMGLGLNFGPSTYPIQARFLLQKIAMLNSRVYEAGNDSESYTSKATTFSVWDFATATSITLA